MSQFPELAVPTLAETIMIGIMIVTFSTAVFLQILAPTFADKPAYRTWAIHLRNGLYMNTLFDKAVRALYTQGAAKQPETELIIASPQGESVTVKEFEKQTA